MFAEWIVCGLFSATPPNPFDTLPSTEPNAVFGLMINCDLILNDKSSQTHPEKSVLRKGKVGENWMKTALYFEAPYLKFVPSTFSVKLLQKLGCKTGLV